MASLPTGPPEQVRDVYTGRRMRECCGQVPWGVWGVHSQAPFAVFPEVDVDGHACVLRCQSCVAVPRLNA